MSNADRGRAVAWTVLALLALAYYGNYYVYDSIGPVAELLERERGFSDSQIGILNAIYSLPNIFLILLGGILVDRLGSARMLVWTAAICLAGALLTAYSPGFNGMAVGRLLFGIGGETFGIALMAGVVKYFTGRNLAFAMAMTLAIARSGSYSADMSPTWFAAAYAEGWQPPLVIAAVTAALSLAACVGYWWLDRRSGVAEPAAQRATLRVPRPAELRTRLLVPPVAVRALVFGDVRVPQHVLDQVFPACARPPAGRRGLDQCAGYSWRRCSRHRRSACSATGPGATRRCSPSARCCFPIVDIHHGDDAVVALGRDCVDRHQFLRRACGDVAADGKAGAGGKFGTALGLMWVAQNIGMGGANVIAGWLNDSFDAGPANPAGYQPMMWFFFVSGALGFAAAMVLWMRAGRRHHEVAGLQVARQPA